MLSDLSLSSLGMPHRSQPTGYAGMLLLEILILMVCGYAAWPQLWPSLPEQALHSGSDLKRSSLFFPHLSNKTLLPQVEKKREKLLDLLISVSFYILCRYQSSKDLWNVMDRKVIWKKNSPLVRESSWYSGVWNKQQRTHCKFILRILFSFSEWPGICELLHLIGSVVTEEEQSNWVLES